MFFEFPGVCFTLKPYLCAAFSPCWRVCAVLLPTLAGHGQHPGRERLCDEGMLAREREQLFLLVALTLAMSTTVYLMFVGIKHKI